MNIISEKLKLLPTDAGVYIMSDKNGVVIYVGKAKNLQNRVRQYFHTSEKPIKVATMVSNIADFNYIITKTEIDALALENTLIKKYKPKFNILLKDDKTYPYIKVNLKEDFPTFNITRRIKKDGSKYFGPYMGGFNVRDILDILSYAFCIRNCSTKITEKAKKPCLNYHIQRCLAPCAGFCDKETYFKRVKKAIAFLEGDDKEVKELLTQKMYYFAGREEFETAREYKEKLNALEKVALKRLTAINKFIDADVIAIESNNIYSAINVILVRKGIVVGAKSYDGASGDILDADAITSFCVQYYGEKQIPSEIIIQNEDSLQLLQDYFKERLNVSVTVSCPKKGLRKELLRMAERNAKDYLEKSIDLIKHKEDMTVNACLRLKELLNLKNYPKRMECYDISNISGVDKVGSMVVFIDGKEERNEYRRFRIKNVEGANDFASLKEVLCRRLDKLNSEDADKFPKPDLVIIDGGKGQLSSVKEIFDEKNISDIDLISLAKREEEVFTIFNKDSIILDKRDYALKVLQRIRDEAHRFAVTYFKSLHNKRNLFSELDNIKGIGKKKKIALMEYFKDIQKIKDATIQELCEVEGIGETFANEIKNYFTDKNNEL